MATTNNNANVSISTASLRGEGAVRLVTGLGGATRLKQNGMYHMSVQELSTYLSEKREGVDQKIMLKGIFVIQDDDEKGSIVRLNEMLSGTFAFGPLEGKDKILYFAQLLKAADRNDLLEKLIGFDSVDVDKLNQICSSFMETSGKGSPEVYGLVKAHVEKNRETGEPTAVFKIDAFSDAATYNRRRSTGGHRRPITGKAAEAMGLTTAGGVARPGTPPGLPPATVNTTVSDEEIESV